MGQAKIRASEIAKLKEGPEFYYHGTTEANFAKIMKSGYLRFEASTSTKEKATFLTNDGMGASKMTAIRHLLLNGETVKIFKIPASLIDKTKLKQSFHHNPLCSDENVTCYKYTADIKIVDNGTEVASHVPKLILPPNTTLKREGNKVLMVYSN